MAWITGRVASLIQSTSSGSASDGEKRYAALQLVGQRQDPCVPEGDVPEYAGHGQVFVHRTAQLVVTQTPDQRPKALALAAIPLNVGTIEGRSRTPTRGRQLER
jgi:hypothetical protein